MLQLSDNDPKKQGLVISVANNLLKFYDPDKVAIEVVTFGPGIDLLRPDNGNRKRVESLVAQGVRFDVCLNTVDTIERDTGKRPEIIPAATPVQVGVGQILSLTENGYTLVRAYRGVSDACLRLSSSYVQTRRLHVDARFAFAGLAADGKPHRIAIQVDQNDPQVMNLALNNATNVIEYYRGKNEDVDVDIVTYGPGLHMLRADTSPVQDRIKRLKDMVFPGKIQFSACNNTKQGMEKAEGHAISIVPDATIVPSGVVRLMELQEQGWSYVRP